MWDIRVRNFILSICGIWVFCLVGILDLFGIINV